jgi:hypothetical protein
VIPATRKMVAGVAVAEADPALAGNVAAIAVTRGVTTVAVPTATTGRTVAVAVTVAATT